MSKIHPANAIKISAVITAAPRLVTALMRAEGFEIPSAWLVWWTPVSAISNLGMAVLEGAAFAYVFSAWRAAQGKHARNLMILAIIAAALFSATVAPSVYVSSRDTLIGKTLPEWALWIWSGAVTLSTIAVVGSVGYATKPSDAPDATRQKSQNWRVTDATGDATPAPIDAPTQTPQIAETPARAYARANGVSLRTAQRRLQKQEATQ